MTGFATLDICLQALHKSMGTKWGINRQYAFTCFFVCFPDIGSVIVCYSSQMEIFGSSCSFNNAKKKKKKPSFYSIIAIIS